MSDYQKNEYGILVVRDSKVNNLQISWDFDVLDDYEKSKYPVFLFTPDMENTQKHYHIELSRKEAKQLRNWLNDYLEDHRG